MKKIPYGIIDYKELQTENYKYVDKTMYLDKLENVGKRLIYLRPGRFGKSLFTSMLSYYYDVNSESLFETLFGSTYVYKNPTSYKNSYYVLKFDFSGITTDNKAIENLEKSFKGCVVTGINEFLQKYQLEYQINMEEDPADIFKYFLSFLKTRNLEHKLYIIIDEYDNFTNAILEGDGATFLSVVGNSSFVKNFYSNIKIYVKESLVDRVFITGICPITMDSMTTGFNIATDISLDPRFASMIGLTHEEVKNLLVDVEEEKREELYELMIENYDGYLFSIENNERIFNATLVMYFLKKYYDFNKIPEELIDKNILVNYGKIENLIKLQNNKFYKEIINSILNLGEVDGKLKTSFNLKEDFRRDDIISLLYYFGYLTIKGEAVSNELIFSIPNYIMKETYYNFFLKLLNDMDIIIEREKRINAILEIIKEGKINKVTDYVSELLRFMSKRGLIKFNERNIQSLYFALLFDSKEFNLYTEYECCNGFIDFLMLPNKQYMKDTILIEFKYIKKEEYNKKLLEKKRIEAESQLIKYSEDERITKENLKRYVVIFVGADVKLIGEV